MPFQFFGDAFRAAVERLHDDAKAAGVSMTAICDDAQVARASPHRYRKGPLPATVETLERMERSLVAIKARRTEEKIAATKKRGKKSC